MIIWNFLKTLLLFVFKIELQEIKKKYSENLKDYNFKDLHEQIEGIYKSYNQSKRLKFK